MRDLFLCGAATSYSRVGWPGAGSDPRKGPECLAAGSKWTEPQVDRRLSTSRTTSTHLAIRSSRDKTESKVRSVTSAGSDPRTDPECLAAGSMWTEPQVDRRQSTSRTTSNRTALQTSQSLRFSDTHILLLPNAWTINNLPSYAIDYGIHVIFVETQKFLTRSIIIHLEMDKYSSAIRPVNSKTLTDKFIVQHFKSMFIL